MSSSPMLKETGGIEKQGNSNPFESPCIGRIQTRKPLAEEHEKLTILEMPFQDAHAVHRHISKVVHVTLN